MATAINITIDQGSAFAQTVFHARDVHGTAINMSGNTGFCMLKKTFTANTPVAELQVSFDVNGGVGLSANSATTAVIPPGWYMYDVVVLNTTVGDYQRILQGLALVSPGVTPGNTAFWSDNPPPAPPGEGGGTPADPDEGAAIPNTE